MKITITSAPLATVEQDETHDEFREMQYAVDRAGWVGTGCTKPFERDEYAGDHKAAGDRK